jgi:hypothetical protein
VTVDPHRIGLKAVSEVPNARMNKPSSIKEPAELFRWNRFDIAFKYLYGVARERGWKTAYYEEMYKHHLGIWNNFSEYDNPAKTGFESYRSDFDDLLDEIGASGFDPGKSLVPIQDDTYVLNGAHRVAACLVHGENVHCVSGEDVKDGQLDCSWKFFSTLKEFGELDESYAGRAALEHAKFNTRSRIVTLYPSAVRLGKLDEVREILRSSSCSIYEKKVNLGKVGSVNFMRELYLGEEWAEANSGSGYADKAELCYKPRNFLRQIAPTHVFLVELDDPETSALVKNEIRALYNIQNHSVHINDTHEETVRLAKCLFNKNSVHFLNTFNGRFFPLFEQLLGEYSAWIEEGQLDSENYCVSAGSVLTAYGVKECKDIDYLHSSPEEVPGNELVTSHNAYGIGRYHTETDDIVHNPENHFYRYGVKYSSLSVVKKLKEGRRESKDFKDIRRIDKLL